MMQSKTIVLAASLLLLSAVSACAENKRSVAEEPVAEWRVYARDPSFAAGYASGVLVGGVWFWTGCRDFSAGELDAYLRYTADPSMMISIAIARFYLDHGCYRISDAEMRDMVEKAKQAH